PATPFAGPVTADRAEHVPAHDVCALGCEQVITHRNVSFMHRVEVPFVQAHPADAERVLKALIRPGDETVERDGHVTGNEAHEGQTITARLIRRADEFTLRWRLERWCCWHPTAVARVRGAATGRQDRKSTRLNSSHLVI